MYKLPTRDGDCKNIVLIEMLSEIWCSDILHHLAKYTRQGDGRLIGWVILISFVAIGLTLAVVQSCTKLVISQIAAGSTLQSHFSIPLIQSV